MTNDHADVQRRYDLFWQLDFEISTINPDDVTADMAEHLLTVLRAIALRTGRAVNLAPPPPAELAEHLAGTGSAATWRRFHQTIRDERIRVGRQLGIEPEPQGS
ncbi:hypothetical protein [Mycolicibacterium nivoides]|uniref:Uncharacterized protein n=1 Tax=Mycolicibacterium nivoides TaxID=2487344 RepID=A0ABW9LK46_9MYCO